MKQKFTLIELLVVVAIIGILASMLLPSLSRARAKAKTSVCVSNLKQVGVGMQLFSMEDKGTLPGPCYYGIKTGYFSGETILSRHLAEFVGQPSPSGTQEINELFNCPSFTTTPSGTSLGNTIQFCTNGRDSEGKRYFGYPNDYDPKTISAVEDPVEETAVTEMDQILVSGNPGWFDDLSASPRHGFSGGAGLRTQLFYDGHALATTKLPQD
ncbi:MAG: type II secretion system GspH family protein [Lentisphaeraceae bacterium]|nr:type II secretion system GspH family protein [Lentisphaeraceae bacterium]